MTERSPAEIVFFAALEKKSPEERGAYLSEACGDDLEMRRRIEQMLAAHPQVGDFMATGSYSGSTGLVATEPHRELSGMVIAGKYKLLEKIGEGGMGEVWVADQLEPIKRRVALKLIKSGMDSRSVLARFEAERQALALMDHPSIARVLDGGTTETGQPYFVMELVKGTPITEFSDARRLTTDQRLELFIPVCQAIQHAHQKGIIHRDIKPSNVLLALYDDMPVPKVIDFGVAKAVGQQLTDKTLYTGFGNLVGTPAYMAPEQATFNQLDIDTRADIYALGVLLYELLAGSPPVEPERLKRAAFDEVLRIVRDEEPPRPSVRLSTSEGKASIASTRQTDPEKLSALMRGEIDWIVMKALEKDRNRRYDSANGLGKDIQRYLSGDAVEACPPTLGYRLRKFSRKHKKSLTTAVAFISLLTVGMVATTFLALWAKTAEREANRQRMASDEARRDSEKAKLEADKQRDAALVTAYTAGMNLAARAWEDNNVSRARELLEGVPRSVAGRDLRGFEWQYLSRVCNAALRTIDGHSHHVLRVVFSPDGNRLATASADRTVKVWSAETGKEQTSIHVPEGPVLGLDFSPDGQRLATGVGSSEPLMLWDSVSGKKLLSLEGHKDHVYGVAFSPDGRCLASGSYDGSVKIWDSTTGKELMSFQHGGYVFNVAFSPDGQHLASAGMSGTIKIWDIASDKERFSLQGHTSTVWSVSFSPDGMRLASGSSDDSVKIWDLANGKELFGFPGTIGCIYSVAYSPDGRRIAGGGDGKVVKVWDSTTGRELSSIKGHGAAVHSVAFSRDGLRLASGSDDRTARIWDSASLPEPLSLEGMWPLAFSKDHRRVATNGIDKNTIKVWDHATGKELFLLSGHQAEVNRLLISPDGQYLASSSTDEKAKVWNMATGRELFSLDDGGSINAIAFSPDGRQLAVARGSYVSFWETASGKKLSQITTSGFIVHGLSYSPNGKSLATGCEFFQVEIWDTTTHEQLLSMKEHTSSVFCVTFSPDGLRVASGSFDETVKVWDRTTGRELFSLKGHAGPVGSVAFSPDGTRLATSSHDGTVKIWDSATGKELISLKDSGSKGSRLEFSPDGERLFAMHDDGVVNIWNKSDSHSIWSLQQANAKGVHAPTKGF